MTRSHLTNGIREGVASDDAGKCRREFLQGLKPIGSVRFTPGLKPRPPKETTSPTGRSAMPQSREGSRVLTPEVGAARLQSIYD